MYFGTNASLFWIDMCSPEQPQLDIKADRITCRLNASACRMRRDLDRPRAVLGHKIINDDT